MSGTKTRILVIRFSSIGDIVLTTPVMRALRHQLDGDVEIHFMTKRKFASVLEGNPNIDRFHLIDRSVQEVMPDLLAVGFDYIIDLHGNIRSRIVKRKLKVLSFTFRKHNFEKWLWVNLGINRMPQQHIVERYMDCLKAFSVKDDGQGLDFIIPEGKGLQPDKFAFDLSEPFIAFAIGAAHAGKKFSPQRLEEMIKSIPHRIILIGGEEDREPGEILASQSSGKVFNACGKLSLHESADIVRRAHLVISGDTGMMHIASAFRKKIISLWGCTVPGFGMYPYRPDAASVILEPHGRNKRPCSKLGNTCKYGMNHRCIDQIKESELAALIEKLWAQ